MNYHKKPVCTIILIALNVIYFLVLSFGGMTEDGYYLLEHGATYVPYVMENKEYYRLFTSIFLHFDINHLMNNMITLGVLGSNVEPVIGKVRFLVIYFISGLGGNLLSLAEELYTQEYAISAGASGAIFGLTGALFSLAIINHGRIGDVTKQGMLFMIAVSLYLGFTGEGVDNFAHVGGLLCGMIIAFLIVPRKKPREQYWYEEV